MNPQNLNAYKEALGMAECPSCGSSKVAETWIDDKFEYGEGKNVSVLTAKIPLCQCGVCDLSFTDWRAEELRNEAVCVHLGIQSPREIVDTRELHDFSQQAFAEISGVGRASLARWESGALHQNASIDNLIYLLRFSENIERLKYRSSVKSEGKAVPSVRQFRALSEQAIVEIRARARIFQLHPAY